MIAPPIPASKTRLARRRRLRLASPRVRQVTIVGHDLHSRRRRLERAGTVLLAQPWHHTRPLVRIRLGLLVPVILFVFSLYQNLGNMDTVDYHRDEARWINRAYFLDSLTDPFGETWLDYYTTRGQPPLGNYVMGIGLLVQGRDLTTNRVWDFHYDDAWNAYAGAMPDLADLNAGRRTNAALGALVVVCVYAIASRLTNRVGGFVAGLFLSLEPLHLRLSSQALSDELLALLLALSFLQAWRFTRNPSVGNGLLLATLLGLGGAAKLSPVVLTLPLAAYGALWLALQLRKQGRTALRWSVARFGWLLVAQPIVGFAVFVLANPYLWPDPIGRSRTIYDFRKGEMDSQASAWPIASVDSPLEAFQRIGRRFNTDYSSSIRVQEWFAHTVSIEFHPQPLDVIFMTAGVIVLIAIVINRGLWSPHALVAYLMAASTGVVIVGMGVDFYRYFLPLLLVLSVCVGVAAGALWSSVAQLRQPAPREIAHPAR
jgi:hypothetical protein